MREIIFRGKRIDDGEWVFGFLSKGRLQGYENNTLQPCIDREEKGVMISSVVDPETIGQYINREDKNENMIFEGDIVLGKTFDDKYFSGIVKFDNASFYIDECGTTSYYAWIDYEVEVLDNIYDVLEPGADDL